MAECADLDRFSGRNRAQSNSIELDPEPDKLEKLMGDFRVLVRSNCERFRSGLLCGWAAVWGDVCVNCLGAAAFIFEGIKTII